MKSFNFSVFLFLLLSLLANPALAKQRKNVVRLRVEGYDAFAKVRSFLDVGVVRKGDACEFLSPLPGTRAAARPWVPFDFYTNVTHESEFKTAEANGTLGEPDIFWEGDNANRNGANQRHDATREVTAAFLGSLEFTERRQDKDSFSYLLQFTRGKVAFERLIRVRTWPGTVGCEADAFDCTKPFKNEKGETYCQPDGWSQKLREVVAEANLTGASYDYVRGIKDEKLKNDVSAIQGIFQRFDSDLNDDGEPYREHVAP